MEGLQTLEKQISDQVVRLNNTLKSFSITLSTLAECELKNCKEFELVSNKYNSYHEELQENTEFLLKVRKAITKLEKELNI